MTRLVIDGDGAGSFRGPQFNLPKLESLTLKYRDVSQAIEMLSLLCMPALTELRLSHISSSRYEGEPQADSAALFGYLWSNSLCDLRLGYPSVSLPSIVYLVLDRVHSEPSDFGAFLSRLGSLKFIDLNECSPALLEPLVTAVLPDNALVNHEGLDHDAWMDQLPMPELVDIECSDDCSDGWLAELLLARLRGLFLKCGRGAEMDRESLLRSFAQVSHRAVCLTSGIWSPERRVQGDEDPIQFILHNRPGSKVYSDGE